MIIRHRRVFRTPVLHVLWCRSFCTQQTGASNSCLPPILFSNSASNYNNSIVNTASKETMLVYLFWVLVECKHKWSTSTSWTVHSISTSPPSPKQIWYPGLPKPPATVVSHIRVPRGKAKENSLIIQQHGTMPTSPSRGTANSMRIEMVW